MKKWNVVFCAALLVLPAIAGLAQGQAEAEVTGEMPPMGPPEEMKQLEHMVGTWTVEGEMFMDPTQPEPTPFTAIAEFEYELGGAIMEMEYTSEMMGMPYTGYSITTWDRENKVWQDSWVDNLSCRQILMTGHETDGQRVMTCVDKYMGTTYHMRNTSYNMTETSFDWKMEQSTDGGETWYTSMTATYTKQ